MKLSVAHVSTPRAAQAVHLYAGSAYAGALGLRPPAMAAFRAQFYQLPYWIRVFHTVYNSDARHAVVRVVKWLCHLPVVGTVIARVILWLIRRRVAYLLGYYPRFTMKVKPQPADTARRERDLADRGGCVL